VFRRGVYICSSRRLLEGVVGQGTDSVVEGRFENGGRPKEIIWSVSWQNCQRSGALGYTYVFSHSNSMVLMKTSSARRRRAVMILGDGIQT